MEESPIDYKELYCKLFRATEAAIRLLIEAQRDCEEAYLTAGERAEPLTARGAQPPEESNSERSAATQSED